MLGKNKTPRFTINDLPNLTGRIAIVTGGNAGMGVCIVGDLARKGAKVYLAARNEQKAMEAIAHIRNHYTLAPEVAAMRKDQDLKIEFLKLDLSEPKSVAAAIADFRSKETKLHMLVNNAGIMMTPYEENSEGIELQWATNYVGHYRLTISLLPCLLAAAREPNTPKGTVRIVNVSSNGYKRFANEGGIIFDDINLQNVSTAKRYGQSKLGNILFTKALKKRCHEEGIWVASVHPGIVDTTLTRGPAASYGCVVKAMFDMASVFALSPEDGALQAIYCAASSAFTEADSGEYFVPIAKREPTNEDANNEMLADKLWEFSQEKYMVF